MAPVDIISDGSGAETAETYADHGYNAGSRSDPWMGMCLVFAWVVFDLDIFWLALGGGLVIGNLFAWVMASSRIRPFELLFTWLFWGFFACLA